MCMQYAGKSNGNLTCSNIKKMMVVQSKGISCFEFSDPEIFFKFTFYRLKYLSYWYDREVCDVVVNFVKVDGYSCILFKFNIRSVVTKSFS